MYSYTGLEVRLHYNLEATFVVTWLLKANIQVFLLRKRFLFRCSWYLPLFPNFAVSNNYLLSCLWEHVDKCMPGILDARIWASARLSRLFCVLGIEMKSLPIQTMERLLVSQTKPVSTGTGLHPTFYHLNASLLWFCTYLHPPVLHWLKRIDSIHIDSKRVDSELCPFPST